MSDRRPIAASRLSRALRALVGLEGQDSWTSVDDCLYIVAPLLPSPFERPEMSRLQQENLVASSRFVAAGGVGFLTRLALFNPVDSGIVAVLEWWWGRGGNFAGDQEGIGWGYVPPAQLGNYTKTNTAYSRDTRELADDAPPPTPVNVGALDVYIRSNIAPLGGEDIIGVVPSYDSAILPWTPQIVIGPGTGVQFFPVSLTAVSAFNLNAAMFWCGAWRARPATRGETR